MGSWKQSQGSWLPSDALFPHGDGRRAGADEQWDLPTCLGCKAGALGACGAGRLQSASDLLVSTPHSGQACSSSLLAVLLRGALGLHCLLI